MRSNYKKIGPYIRQVDVRNTEDKKENLLGVSTQKVFIDSIANTIGTDFRPYKIVKRRQFTYVPDTSRRGDKIGIALLETHDEGLISAIYTVFEIIDHNELLPEYLMMWFRRPEFDRYARFKSHGSVRELFDWEEMCDVELPVPSIEKQREIVKEYYTIVDRIKLNEQLNQKLEETAQAIYKQWFVDFEFPDEKGKPYKSSGGEMVFNELLKLEIPKGWVTKDLKQLAQIKGGKRLPAGEQLISDPTAHPYIKVADMGASKYVCMNNKFEYLSVATQKDINRYIVQTGNLIISIVGTIGTVRIIDKSLNGANLTENCARINNVKKVTIDYLYHYFYSKNGREEIEMKTVGGVQGKLPLYNIGAVEVLIPDETLISQFSAILVPINQTLSSTINEVGCLAEMREVILARISRLK